MKNTALRNGGKGGSYNDQLDVLFRAEGADAFMAVEDRAVCAMLAPRTS